MEAPRHHYPSVINLAITFCLALVGLRLVLVMLGWQTSQALAANALWSLELIVVLATLLYLLLRRGEGDFRATFIVCFGLFIGTEGLSALARNYGLAALGGLSSLFNQAQLVYATLALVAAAAEGVRPGVAQRVLVAASAGLAVLGVARAFLEFFYREKEGLQNLVLALVLAALAGYLAVLLARGERKPVSRPQSAAESVPGKSGLEGEC